MEPAAEGQSAVLLVKGKGINLQVTGRDHLDGFVVLHHPRGVNIHIWDNRGFALIHTKERGKNM